MKKVVYKSAAVAAFLLATLGAQAQSSGSGMYGELGWTNIAYKDSGYNIEPSMLRAIVGVDVHPNLAVEGMLGFGISDDTVTIRGVNVKTEIDNAWGVFLKPKTAVTPDLDLFARLGYVKAKVSASVPGYSASDSGGDMAYGLGLSYKLSDKMSLNADYMSYYNKNDVKGTGFTVGLGIRF